MIVTSSSVQNTMQWRGSQRWVLAYFKWRHCRRMEHGSWRCASWIASRKSWASALKASQYKQIFHPYFWLVQTHLCAPIWDLLSDQNTVGTNLQINPYTFEYRNLLLLQLALKLCKTNIGQPPLPANLQLHSQKFHHVFTSYQTTKCSTACGQTTPICIDMKVG